MDVMDNGYKDNGISWFDGHIGLKYEMWNNKMKTFLGAQGYDVWYSIVTGYTSPKKPKTTTKKELKRNNKMEMDFILEGLCDSVKDRVGQCSSAKELWDTLHNLYSKESPITKSHCIKESEEQEEICTSCQTDSEEEYCE
jgi:hypothetical protein